ncbi:hypothetical protein, partial [Staphylococcus chromogenes]
MSVLDININKLLIDYSELSHSKSLFKGKKVKSLITVLSDELLELREMSDEEFQKDLKLLEDFRKVRETLQNRNDNFIDSFGNAWKGRVTDLEELKLLVYFIENNNLKDFDNVNKKIILKLVDLKINVSESY